MVLQRSMLYVYVSLLMFMMQAAGLADRAVSSVSGGKAPGCVRRLCDGVQGLDKFRQSQVQMLSC